MITIFAILLVVQPIIQTGIEVVKELVQVKRALDPATRPVTRAELDIVNQKIDFNNQLILADIWGDAKHEHVDKSHATTDNENYSHLENNLTNVQKKLDADFKEQKK